MKKFMRIFLALIVVLTVTTLSAYAERGGYYRHGGGHGGFGLFVGPGWWGPYSYPYYPYYPSYPVPPVIIQQPPEIYVQPTPQVEAPSYWYYCQEPQGYYPYVKKCPKGWMKVVPPVTGPDGEE
jgi:hypothetical protein